MQWSPRAGRPGRVVELLGPDFFIIGAPKCGTTALNNYLAQHDEIGMCPRKETHFFATDLKERMALRRRLYSREPDDYLRLFEDLQDRRRRGEASVWYLYSAAAPRKIVDFCPEAQAIVMLRNPFEMLPSLHSQFVFVGIEPVEDFEAALALDPRRERSGAPQGFPPRSYRSAIRYSEQLARYVDVLGRDRVHAIVFERFQEDPLLAFQGTCRFLGVDSSIEPEISVINPNKEVRSRLVRLARRPPESLRPLLHAVTPQQLRHRISRRLIKLNTRTTQREPVAAQTLESIRPEVERQVEELRELIGVDVSHWLD